MSETATPDYAERMPPSWAEAIARAPNPYEVSLARYARAPIAFVREVLLAEPDDWQLKVLRALARGHTRIAVRSCHGPGKLMCLDDVVPSPDGERRWGDLRPGDRLFGRDGEATHIVARHDRGVMPIYRVSFDDGTSLRVGADHLWTVRGETQRRVSRHPPRYRKGSGRHEIPSAYAADFITLSTAELLAHGVRRPNGIVTARRWELPPHAPVQYQARDVPLAPYLLGAALADAGLTRTTSLTLTGSAAKLALWQEHAAANALTARAWRDERTPDNWTMTIYGQAEALREAGVSGMRGADRSVPLSYRENTPAVRLAVLQGLMDADGYIDDQGCASYTSISRRLAEDVAWLVRSLGGKAFVSNARPSHYRSSGQRVRTQDHYDVSVRLPVAMSLFTLPGKAGRVRPRETRYLARWIDSIELDGEAPAMCVEVDAPDGLYLARDFIVTHNTALAAWVAVWFSNTRAPFKLAMTAPSSPQLFDALYPEVIKWLDRLPGAWRELWHVTSDHITLKANSECFITARTSRPETPEALAGLHSDNILLVVDEASGVPEQVFEAASGSMSSAGAITLLIGNPTRSSGFFWKAFMLERDRWFCMKVGYQDSPRVTQDFADEIAGRYGQDSNAYRVRVLGEFPLADADTLIPAELVDSAMVRDTPLDGSPEIWGVDVARFGTDASVLIKRRGNVVPEMPRSFHQLDTMMLAGAIKAEWDAQITKPALICIDVIGIGAGVVDRLNEQGLPILGVNVSESPSTTGRYARLRDELWVRCKEWLSSRAVRLPRHERLRDDLVAPRYAFLSDGRLKVEDKNSMRARGLPSCDYADALNLTFCQQGLGVGSGMSGGIYDKVGLRMDLGAEVEV